MAKKDKAIEQAEFAGMEQPKIPELERAGRKYREAISVRLGAAADEKNKHAKLKELMHTHCGNRVVKEGADTFLLYARGGRNPMEIKLKITEKAKVLMDDEIDETDPGAPPADDLTVDEGGEAES